MRAESAGRPVLPQPGTAGPLKADRIASGSGQPFMIAFNPSQDCNPAQADRQGMSAFHGTASARDYFPALLACLQGAVAAALGKLVLDANCCRQKLTTEG